MERPWHVATMRAEFAHTAIEEAEYAVLNEVLARMDATPPRAKAPAPEEHGRSPGRVTI